ncbi:uncharacterized protein isoform X2 [Musca autumnalis]|uniref:uncharacterized protein isoform X2 n=1 Tax=Musca autumnalis TaxID=221902 RepID=UPI003CE72198
MKYFCIILLFICVICNASQTSALKRIKRNATVTQTRKKIPKDFVLVQKQKPDEKERKTNGTTTEDSSLYDTVLASFTDGKPQDLNNQKFGPPVQKRDHIVNNSQSEDILKDTFYKNNLKALNNLDIPLEDGGGTANIVSAHVVLPVQPITSGSLNPFDQMMRYANMWWYNMGLETDSNQLNEGISHQSLHLDNANTKSNKLHQETPQYSSKADHEPYEKNLNYWSQNINRPLSPGQGNELSDMFGNALHANHDTYCPIHHNKMTLRNGKTYRFNNNKDNDQGEGLVQVCSCHFMKNPSDKENIKNF